MPCARMNFAYHCVNAEKSCGRCQRLLRCSSGRQWSGRINRANCLAKQGHSVLVLEHHYQFGGLATWFKRAGGHIFDISLHGFPVGMIKSCRRYWTKEIADSIVQLKNIRFVNPQYDLRTTFDRVDFTNILHEKFKLAKHHVEAFTNILKGWITLPKMAEQLATF